MPKFLTRRQPVSPDATLRAARTMTDCRRAGRPLAASGRAMSEQQIHRAVVQHLRQRGVLGLVFVHPPNGGYRHRAEAAIFSALGVRAGVADLLLWHDGKSFALELKSPGGRASEAQLAFLSDMERAGAYTALVEGLDRALKTLEAWGLLRGKAS
jgi:VRR-NUC domain